MRRISLYIFCALLLFPQPAKCDDAPGRGLFVTVVQEPPVLSSRKAISELIAFAKRARIKTLFVQIYHANQAWFPSNVADSAPYKACVKNISKDPLGLLIKEAHAEGIQVHAWLNVLSLGNNKDAAFLKKYGVSVLTRNLKSKNKLEDYKIDDQYFLEPGDPRIRQDIVKIVEEILKAYPDLDGIQFDYLRYPDMHPAYGYTKINIERFKKATGRKTIAESSPAWKDWKRAQVTEFLEILVNKARAIRPHIHVSATGCMPYSRAYYEAFQDWPAWISRGLVDFVTVMSYSPDTAEFKEWITAAKSKAVDFKKVNIGVGAYKLTHSPEIFEREFRFCERSGAGTCVVFHYGSLLENPVLGNFLTGNEKPRGK